MQFDLTFSWAWIGLATVVASLGLGWSLLRLRGWIPKKHFIPLGLLRGSALLFLVLALLNPYTERKEPDSSAFELVVLADSSGSMETPDTRGYKTRADAVEDMIRFGEETNLFTGPLAAYPVNPLLFNEEAVPWRPGGSYRAAGMSAPGETLATLLKRDQLSGNSLGGVVLISDGNENSGIQLIQTAKQFRNAEIPISVIGVGENTPPGDVEVGFSNSELEAEVGDAVTLSGQVTNRFNFPKSVTVQLYRGGHLLEEREINLAPGETRGMEFQDEAEFAGVQTYRMRVGPLAEDTNPASDVDFATLVIRNPEEYEILFLGSQLHWEFRFLRQALREDPRFKLDSLIRTGPTSYLQRLTGEEGMTPLSEIPQEPSFYHRYEAVILDTRLVPLLSGQVVRALHNMVTRRGAGMLGVGPLNDLPESLASMLPVKTVEAIIYRDKRFLELEVDPVFASGRGGVLFQNPRPYLPENTPVYLGTDKSRGGRTSARTLGKEHPILAVQAYGAGSTAYLGTENTWRWHMESERGQAQHARFWQHLLFWLASGGKERMDMPLQGSVQSLESEVDLDLKVRAQDFGPESEARVTARVEQPSGESAEILLNPSLTLPGIYQGGFTPGLSGEYQVRYAVEYEDGELLEQDAFFAVSPTGPELADTEFRESLLRDVARLTGGSYASYRDWKKLGEVPVADHIPVVVHRYYWARGWPYFLVLALFILSEWYRRRMLGLK